MNALEGAQAPHPESGQRCLAQACPLDSLLYLPVYKQHLATVLASKATQPQGASDELQLTAPQQRGASLKLTDCHHHQASSFCYGLQYPHEG